MVVSGCLAYIVIMQILALAVELIVFRKKVVVVRGGLFMSGVKTIKPT